MARCKQFRVVMLFDFRFWPDLNATEWAAWVQATGSIAAVVGAAKIASWQYRRTFEDKQELEIGLSLANARGWCDLLVVAIFFTDELEGHLQNGSDGVEKYFRCGSQLPHFKQVADDIAGFDLASLGIEAFPSDMVHVRYGVRSLFGLVEGLRLSWEAGTLEESAIENLLARASFEAESLRSDLEKSSEYLDMIKAKST